MKYTKFQLNKNRLITFMLVLSLAICMPLIYFGINIFADGEQYEFKFRPYINAIQEGSDITSDLLHSIIEENDLTISLGYFDYTVSNEPIYKLYDDFNCTNEITSGVIDFDAQYYLEMIYDINSLIIDIDGGKPFNEFPNYVDGLYMDDLDNYALKLIDGVHNPLLSDDYSNFGITDVSSIYKIDKTDQDNPKLIIKIPVLTYKKDRDDVDLSFNSGSYIISKNEDIDYLLCGLVLNGEYTLDEIKNINVWDALENSTGNGFLFSKEDDDASLDTTALTSGSKYTLVFYKSMLKYDMVFEKYLFPFYAKIFTYEEYSIDNESYYTYFNIYKDFNYTLDFKKAYYGDDISVALNNWNTNNEEFIFLNSELNGVGVGFNGYTCEVELYTDEACTNKVTSGTFNRANDYYLKLIFDVTNLKDFTSASIDKDKIKIMPPSFGSYEFAYENEVVIDNMMEDLYEEMFYHDANYDDTNYILTYVMKLPVLHSGIISDVTIDSFSEDTLNITMTVSDPSQIYEVYVGPGENPAFLDLYSYALCYDKKDKYTKYLYNELDIYGKKIDQVVSSKKYKINLERCAQCPPDRIFKEGEIYTLYITPLEDYLGTYLPRYKGIGGFNMPNVYKKTFTLTNLPPDNGGGSSHRKKTISTDKSNKGIVVLNKYKKLKELKVLDVTTNKELKVTKDSDGTYYYYKDNKDDKVKIEITYYPSVIKLYINKLDSLVNDIKAELDTSPVIRNDRTMLPVRFISEMLDFEVTWDDSNRVATLLKGDTKIKIEVGSNKAYINDKEYILDSPSFIENDRTYMPVRFIVEALGSTITWDEPKQEVTIKEKSE